MHSLVVALLEECFDPAIVSLHAPKTTKMSQHASDHAWNSGNTFKEDESNQLLHVRLTAIFKWGIKYGGLVLGLPIEPL
jgi:hypothetical protein